MTNLLHLQPRQAFGRVALAALAAALIVLLGQSQVSAAAPVLNAANGHYYQSVSVSGGLTWPEANAAAQALTFNGLQGHLVTVTSGAETTFLVTNGLAVDEYFAGGFQDAGAASPSAGWNWVTGESFGSYTNWGSGEPNDAGGAAGEDGTEQYLEFWHPRGRGTTYS